MFYIYKHASTHKHTQFPLFFSICFPAEGFQVRLQNRDSLLPGALIPSHQHNVGQHDGKGRRCKYDYYASLFKGNAAEWLCCYDFMIRIKGICGSNSEADWYCLTHARVFSLIPLSLSLGRG